MSYKNICCVTGSRAEYGIFKPLLDKLKNSPKFNLSLVVTGSHFSPLHGCSVSEVNKSFEIDLEIDAFTGDDTKKSKVIEMSKIQSSFANYLSQKVDLVLLVGDRYEILPVAVAAYMTLVPIAHIHGGEETKGSLDNGIRHAISQLSTFHFTSNDNYSDRLIRMGADPTKVVNVGALGIERINSHNSKSKEFIEDLLSFRFNKQNIICTIHPPTNEDLDVNKLIKNLINIFDEYDDMNVIFTGANADFGGAHINNLLSNIANKSEKYYFYSNLGESLFIDFLKNVDLIIGNSSSAFLEAPALKVPAINIGSRQDGRVTPLNVFSTKPSVSSLKIAIKKALNFKN